MYINTWSEDKIESQNIVTMGKALKVIDLTYLQSMGGDEIVNEMLEVYLEQVPEFINGFKDTIGVKDYLRLSKVAHKAKGSVGIVGMNDLATDLKKLQLLSENCAKYQLDLKKENGTLPENEIRELEHLSDKKISTEMGYDELEVKEMLAELDKFMNGEPISIIPGLVDKAISAIGESADEVQNVLKG